MSSAPKYMILVLLELEFYSFQGGVVITSVCAMDIGFFCCWPAFS